MAGIFEKMRKMSEDYKDEDLTESSNDDLLDKIQGDTPNKDALKELSKRLGSDEELEAKISMPSIGVSRGGITYSTESDGTGSKAFTGSGFPTTSGGMISTTTGSPWVSSPPYGPATPTTTTLPYPGTAWPEAVMKKVARKIVRLPSKFTEKVLVAFLDPDQDDNKNVVWAANLQPEQIELVKGADGEVKLHLTLSLEDVYGNLGDDEEEEGTSSSS